MVGAEQMESARVARVTHVEIRRVQNGFVVQAVDYEDQDYRRGSMEERGVKAVFVANNEQELQTVITNILTATDLKWLPSMDIPMVSMKQYMEKLGAENGRLRGQSESMQGPAVAMSAQGANFNPVR